MSVPVEIRKTAESVLTTKQLEAFELECAGHGTMAIARKLWLTRAAVRDRLHNAHTALLRAGLRQDPTTGEWRREEAA